MLGERHVHCDKMLHVGALLHEARRVHPARGGKVSSREERREAYRTRVETQGRSWQKGSRRGDTDPENG